MGDLVSIRCKMGVEIRCESISGGFVYLHKGRPVHVTTDDVRSDPVAAEAHFFTAWRDVSGFVPFTVLRRFRGRMRSVGVCFMPRGEASRLATRCNRQRSPDASHRYAVRRDCANYL